MPSLADRQHWPRGHRRIHPIFCYAPRLIRRLCLPGSDNILRVPVIAGSERGREAHGGRKLKSPVSVYWRGFKEILETSSLIKGENGAFALSSCGCSVSLPLIRRLSSENTPSVVLVKRRRAIFCVTLVLLPAYQATIYFPF